MSLTHDIARKVTTSARNLTGTPPAGSGKKKEKKKPRKPYTISRPREEWTADEHDRFHAMRMFGHDWKTIGQFVATKTATQIRSHAQKHFLKVHKLAGGLAAPLPPLTRPPRATGAVLPRPTAASSAAPVNALQSAMNWAPRSAACWSDSDDSTFTATPDRSEQEAWVADSLSQDDGTVELPLAPDDRRFAEVYRFVGDAFGSGAPSPVEVQLRRLRGMDPVVAETVLLVLRNLEDNLYA